VVDYGHLYLLLCSVHYRVVPAAGQCADGQDYEKCQGYSFHVISVRESNI